MYKNINHMSIWLPFDMSQQSFFGNNKFADEVRRVLQVYSAEGSIVAPLTRIK